MSLTIPELKVTEKQIFDSGSNLIQMQLHNGELYITARENGTTLGATLVLDRIPTAGSPAGVSSPTAGSPASVSSPTAGSPASVSAPASTPTYVLSSQDGSTQFQSFTLVGDTLTLNGLQNTSSDAEKIIAMFLLDGSAIAGHDAYGGFDKVQNPILFETDVTASASVTIPGISSQPDSAKLGYILVGVYLDGSVYEEVPAPGFTGAGTYHLSPYLGQLADGSMDTVTLGDIRS